MAAGTLAVVPPEMPSPLRSPRMPVVRRNSPVLPSPRVPAVGSVGLENPTAPTAASSSTSGAGPSPPVPAAGAPTTGGEALAVGAGP
eukprot:922804-Alexandrium_andersonii.AAC.1